MIHASCPTTFSACRDRLPLRRRLIGFLQKAEQQRIGIARLAYGVIRQDKLAELVVVSRFGGLEPRAAVASRLRIGIDVERRATVTAIARPEAAARYFVRIGFVHHPLR